MAAMMEMVTCELVRRVFAWIEKRYGITSQTSDCLACLLTIEEPSIAGSFSIESREMDEGPE